MEKEIIIKLLKSSVFEDFLIGLSLFVKNGSKSQFLKFIKDRPAKSGERIACFEAYDSLWKIVATTSNRFIIFDNGGQDLDTCLGLGYKYIEL